MKRVLSVLIACLCVFIVTGTYLTSPVMAESGGPTGPAGQFTIGWDPMDLPGMQADYALDLYGGINSAERVAEVTPRIAGLNAHGISYMAYYGFDHVEGDAYDYFPALNTDVNGDGIIDGVWTSLEGNYSEDYGMPGYYQHTIGSPAFRDYLVGSAELSIDAGTTAVCYDVAVFTTNSFDPGSTSAFTDYLVSEGYTTAELGLPTETDLATFDYGEYLRNQGYTDTGMSCAASGWWENPDNPDYSNLHLDNPLQTPLWEVWVTWHDVFLHQFVQELSTTTKDYAATQYGRAFYLTFNRYGNGQRWLVSDIADFECGETFINDESYHYPHQSMAPVYKANLTADGTRFWSWNWPVIRDGGGALTDIAALYTAETFASGGIVQFTLSPDEDDLREVLVPYSRLVREYPDLTGLTPESSTAIFYGLGVNLGNERSFKGTACLVADSHAVYDVVFGGDGTIRADTLTANDLIPYEVVILPNVWFLTENQISVFLDYLNGGGVLIVTGSTDTGENADWANLLNGGGGSYGAGEVVVIAGDPGYEYWNVTEQSQKDMLLSSWQTATTAIVPQISMTYPADVNIYSYLDMYDDSNVYHVVNSVYDDETGQVTEQVGQTITLPYPVDRTGDVTVSLIRPGDSTPSVLGSFSPGDTVTVTIDNLDIWGILKVGSAIPAPLAIDDKPFSEAKDVFDYEFWSLTGEDNMAVVYEASDDADLADVTLYYRYRANNADDWGTWTPSVTEMMTGEPVTRITGTLYFDPTETGAGGDGQGEGYYQFYTLAQDDNSQAEPDKGWAETERGYDITPPPDILYTETHGILSGEGTQIENPSFTWVTQEDELSGLPVMEGEDCWQIMWGPTGNPGYYAASTQAFTPDPIYPNGAETEYRFQVRISDLAGNWNGGDEGAFVYRLELPGAPYILSYEADSILKTSARLNAYLGSPGDAEEVQVSFVWGTEPGEYLYETDAEVLTESRDVTANLTDLSPETTYYFRAKAVGMETYTVYGDEIRFTTAGADTCQLTVDSQPGGSVTIPGEGNFLYNLNEVADLTAVADEGYRFLSWSGDTATVDNPDASITTILMDGDYSITATFIQDISNTPPDKPVNQLPGEGTTNPTAEFTLQASGFSDADEDGHSASQWQILDGQDGIIWDSSETSECLTSYLIPGDTLGEGVTCSWHVRYKDDREAWSEWSDTTTFTTYSSTEPGDANDDGAVNALDMTKVARIILLLDSETPGADADGNGVVNVLDITEIVKMILGMPPYTG